MNYLQKIAQRIRDETPTDDLPDDDTTDLLLSYALLAEVKGTAVTNEDVHNAWVAWMTGIDPDHESLVPYHQLDASTKKEDSVFTRAIKTVAGNLS